MTTRTPDAEPLLTPAEVATMFRVDPKTVTRWAKAGKLSSIRTLGGHRRYRESEVRDLLTGMVPEQRRGDEDRHLPPSVLSQQHHKLLAGLLAFG
jgi:excisionase family DNA binding protein